MRAVLVTVCLCWSACTIATTLDVVVAQYLKPNNETELHQASLLLQKYMHEHRGQLATFNANRSIEAFYLQSIALQNEDGDYPIKTSDAYTETEALAESVLSENARSDSQIFYFLGDLMRRGNQYADQLISEFIPELSEHYIPIQQLAVLAESENNYVAIIALIVAHNQDPRSESEFAPQFRKLFAQLVTRSDFAVAHLADFEGFFAQSLFEQPISLKLSLSFWQSLLNLAESVTTNASRVIARTAEYQYALDEDPKLGYLFLGPSLELLWLYKIAEFYRTKDVDEFLEQQFQRIYRSLNEGVQRTRAFVAFDYLNFDLLSALAEAKVFTSPQSIELKRKLVTENSGKKIVKRAAEILRHTNDLAQFQQVITQNIHRAVVKHSKLDLLANALAIEALGDTHKTYAKETRICQIAFGF